MLNPQKWFINIFTIFFMFYRSRGEGWRVNIVTTSDFSLDKRFYYTEETRTVKHNEETIFSRVYKNKFDRNPLTKICWATTKSDFSNSGHFSINPEFSAQVFISLFWRAFLFITRLLFNFPKFIFNPLLYQKLIIIIAFYQKFYPELLL